VDFHFGKLNRVVVDNRFHRIHHSVEPQHLDKNFGIWLSCWDYMYGTAYTPKPGEWPKVLGIGIAPPKTVREFLASHQQYPQRLTWTILTSADELFRVAGS
jgi:sterol desaturase/sphingolipid hydroxylase (fatty acid hydroxylase superfamily)